MRVKVDSSICQGCGICQSIAPDIFRLRAEPYAVALVRMVPQEKEVVVREASDACPEEAILLSD